ncbi:type 4a pilus biogenesis protein PilO [Pseudomonas sp. 148P]|uniref:Type 4a pilus biogenesis protein PilO n=1 Tax=Pseudomonas ulcerans TaxID=3115852 RepID=A0ABU7HME3_9PSED|nr:MULTISPECIES: type 4a pilus biogenesis protein PilO [unclassified Pseudomonas]MEE1921741.1 type 4a pilus biogenesis protein PilO [Pseudomonas sp. 147P]MEE1932700.1 type 4a pilus biogenesis protein PilO [Pseudomonas sp. 148P]
MSLSFIDGAVDWRALLRWSLPIKAALLGLCLSLVPALVYGLYGRAQLEALAGVQARHSELQQQWQTRSAEADALAAHREKVAQLQDDLSQARSELFDDDGLASLLQSLARLGSGLSFEQVTALEAQVQPNHVELPLQLQVSGEYRSLSRFLSGLGGLDKLVTVHELDLTAAGEQLSGVLRMSLRLQAYRAVDAQGTQASGGTAAMVPRNPFERVDVPALAGGGVAADQARLVGHLRDREGWVALVHLGSTLHMLREGDRFGAGRVSVIEEGRVELLGATEGAAGITRVLTLARG